MNELEKLERWYQQRAQAPELAAKLDTCVAALKAAVRQTQELYAGAPMEPSWLAAAEAAIALAEGGPAEGGHE